MVFLNFKRTELAPVLVDYDQAADVLYLRLGAAVPGYGETQQSGVTLRYALEDDSPIGATVIGYKSGGFSDRRDDLLIEIARHLRIDTHSLAKAMSLAGV